MTKPTLHVLTTLFNPISYKRRTILFEQFVRRMSNYPNVRLHVAILMQPYQSIPWDVMTALAERKDVASCVDLTVWSDSVLWHKERLLGLLLNRLLSRSPDTDVDHIAWIDADLNFLNPDVIDNTLDALMRWDVVQMFVDGIDLNRDGTFMHNLRQSFGFQYQRALTGAKVPFFSEYAPAPAGTSFGTFGHPGYAWAANVAAWSRVGFLDRAILGSADYIMAMSLIGKADRVIKAYAKTPAFAAYCAEWNEKSRGLSFGYVPGAVVHYFHGEKKHRQFGTRDRLLAKHSFDPLRELVVDYSGVYRLVNKPVFQDDIVQYFVDRREDE